MTCMTSSGQSTLAEDEVLISCKRRLAAVGFCWIEYRLYRIMPIRIQTNSYTYDLVL